MHSHIPPSPRGSASLAGLLALTLAAWTPHSGAETTVTVDAGIAQGAHKLISRSYSQGSSDQADENQHAFWNNLQGRFRALNTDLVRINAGSLISTNTDGSINYSTLDLAIDTIVADGARPLVTMGLGATLENPTETAAIITALVARYKTRNNGAIGYWEIMNEPDHPVHSPISTVEQYNDYYDFAVAAIRAADPDAKIGGMALAELNPNSTWMIPFLDHVKATRDTPVTTDDLPLDFVSFHFYSNGQGPHNNPNSQLGDQIQWTIDWMAARNLTTEVMITEYNLSAEFFSKSEDNYNAARTIELVNYITNRFPNDSVRLFNFQPKDGIIWAGEYINNIWHVDRNYGGWGLLSVDNYAKPVYNLLKMYSNMPGTRLSSWLSANPPAGLGSMASKSGWDATGRQEVLVWNNSNVPQDVKVYSYNIPFATATLKEYSRIDIDERSGNQKYNVLNADSVLADLNPATPAIDKTIQFSGSTGYTTPIFTMKPHSVSKLIFKAVGTTAPPVPTTLVATPTYQNTILRWKDGSCVATRSEAEAVVSVAASDSITNFSEAGASAGAGEKLNANAANDYVTYTLPSIPEGTYTVKVGGKTGSTRGKFQVSIGGVNVGGVINQYSAATGIYEQYDLGKITFSSAGTRAVKFTVLGKQTASTGYDIVVDYIELEPVDAYKATGYNVLRSTTAGGTYTTIASNVSGTMYNDSQGTYNVDYYYKVQAVNHFGTSAASAASSAAKWTYNYIHQTTPVAYVNRFDDSASLNQLSNLVGNWSVVNGELVESNTVSSNYSATLPGVTLSEGAVEFDLKIDGAGGWAGVELVNASDTYRFILFAHGMANLFKNGTQVTGGQAGTNVYPRDDFQHVKITYNAGSKIIRVFLQGTKYFEYTDGGATMSPATTVRLIRYSNYVTRYDNLEVHHLDNYLETFSNVGMANWKTNGGTWSVDANGALLQATTTAGTFMAASPLLFLQNGSVEADIKIISGASTSWGGLLVKRTDPDATPLLPTAGYLVFIRANGTINVRNNLTGVNMLATDFATGLNPMTTAVKLKVSFEDSVMKIYYNGITNATLTITDRSFVSGSVGLATGSSKSTFDNVKVSK